jgi:PIN domain nuclease of toxin-antitoxin system
VIHLDTHVLVWIATGALDRLPEPLVQRLPDLPLRVSPMAVLELSYLHEIGRLQRPAAEVMERLTSRLALRVAEADFSRVAALAAQQSWTRDPFDRLIVASALADDLPLVTADRRILEHCPLARWHDAVG